MKKKNFIFVVNHLTFLVSHRLKILKFLNSFFNVYVITGKFSILSSENKAYKILKKNKINIYIANYNSTKLSFFSDLIGFLQICKIFIILRPQIIHLLSNKVIFLGFFAATICNIKNIVISIAGFGFVSSSKKFYYRSLGIFFSKLIYFFSLLKKNHLFIVQNIYDKKILLKKFFINSKKIFLIPGSGVDISKLKPTPFYKRKNIVILPARVIKSKGIIEFINAAKYLKKNYSKWNFLVIGTLNYESPDSFSKNHLKNFLKLKYIKFLGHKDNIIDYYKKASIICLPSYNEGFPKCLIEANILKIPIVATNVGGCRSIVKNNINGYLVPPRNTDALIKTLKILILNQNIRLKMFKNSKLINSKYFDEIEVAKKHIKIYNNFIR